MTDFERPKAFITGGSRGIGAETALALGYLGWDVAIGVHDKIKKAEGVAGRLGELGVTPLIVAADLADPKQVRRVVDEVSEWAPQLDALDLNAAIGLEEGVTIEDARAFNRDHQVALAKGLMPTMGEGSTVLLVMSHWAQHYREGIDMPPFERGGKTYDVVASTKREGLEALSKEVEPELKSRGGRLIVVTAGVVKGTPVSEMGLRAHPDFADGEKKYTVDASHVGFRVAAAINNPFHESGHVVHIGETAGSFVSRWERN